MGEDLLEILRTTEDPFERNEVAIALLDAHDPNVLPVLADLLLDPRTEGYRGTLLWVLGEFWRTENLEPYRPVLEAILRDPEETFEAITHADWILDMMDGPSKWLTSLWSSALETASDAFWRLVPDQIGNVIHTDGSIRPADLQFLRDKTRVVDSRVESVCALRTLARISEDHPLLIIGCETTIITACLEHPDPAVRIAAAEAIWQVGIKKAVPELRQALGAEMHNEVRTTFEHVIRVLSPE